MVVHRLNSNREGKGKQVGFLRQMPALLHLPISVSAAGPQCSSDVVFANPTFSLLLVPAWLTMVFKSDCGYGHMVSHSLFASTPISVPTVSLYQFITAPLLPYHLKYFMFFCRKSFTFAFQSASCILIALWHLHSNYGLKKMNSFGNNQRGGFRYSTLLLQLKTQNLII